MLPSRFTRQKSLNFAFVQRYCSVSLPTPSTACSSIGVLRLSNTLSHQHVVRWKSGSSFPYLEESAKFQCLDDVAAGKRIASSGELTSICQVVQEFVKNTSNLTRMSFALRSCAKLSSDENAVTSLIVSVLDRVADLPPNTWLDSDNQNELQWILHTASQCQCITPRFENVILQHLNVQPAFNTPRIKFHYAFSLTKLNIPSTKLAVDLMNSQVVSADARTEYYYTDLLAVILYCALSGVDCSMLTEKVDMYELIKDCKPWHLQMALLLTSLPATDRQQRWIDSDCRHCSTKQPLLRSVSRCAVHSLMAHLVGSECLLPARHIAGIEVQAAALFDQDLKPMLSSQCPRDVLVDTSIDVQAARRHGLHAVAAIGYTGAYFLRHPHGATTGWPKLEVLALQSVGCFTVPVQLEANRTKPQTQFATVGDLMFNFPAHIHPFSSYVAP